ncbi:MAG: TRAP transporter small permease subunit [Deltaproteobacteria bacterium]|nr:TRAP transporter small permease subunit [Deltaproteobacteria bacterium]MBW1960642.1 TRAP transporter small permease subunit [Deltaproteobacteria bacterium]MBW1996242.1 TRAP transporter small permease subunit [Deltaproteobacteria bacterium]MBW2150648.1 TRAP transporter small permease subunit [Deltaproteobacteria bacterium]
MERLKKFMVAVEKTNIFIGKLMVGLTLLAVFVITFEVVMRYVFGLPTNWGHELMTLLFAVQYMFVAGYCHYHRAHVRVDVFYSTRKFRTRAYLDLFTSAFFFFFTLVLLWTCWTFYWSSQTMHGGGTVFGIEVPGELSLTDWAPPYYPVKFMMPAGAFMLLLQGIVWFIRDLHIAITGRELK